MARGRRIGVGAGRSCRVTLELPRAADALLAFDRALDARVAECEPFPTDAAAVYATLAAGLREIVAAERAAAQQLAALVA